GTGEQAGQAGQGDHMRASAGGGDASDQRHIADQPVHRAEHRWAQPAAGDVAVAVMNLSFAGAGGRGGHVASVRSGSPGASLSGESLSGGSAPVSASSASRRTTKYATAPMKTTMLVQ